MRTRLCHVPKPADEYLNAGRHHWPIAQLVDWLLKSGLAFECPADAPDPVEASPWAKIMILGNWLDLCVPDILWTVVGFYFFRIIASFTCSIGALEDMFGKVPGFKVVYSVISPLRESPAKKILTLGNSRMSGRQIQKPWGRSLGLTPHWWRQEGQRSGQRLLRRRQGLFAASFAAASWDTGIPSWS